MPKRERIFPGITRQVVISDDTHQLLVREAQRENKYIGELADELLRHALEKRPKPLRKARGTDTVTPTVAVERLKLNSPRVYHTCHCLVCNRDWVIAGKEGMQGEDFTLPQRCNYPDCRAAAWNDPITAPAARRKRAQRLARYHGHLSTA